MENLEENDFVVQKTLQIRLVLHKIMENLPVPTLKNCRLVNSIWCVVSSEILKLNDNCLTLIKYSQLNEDSPSTSTKIFRHSTLMERHSRGHEVNFGARTLENLNKLLTKSINFPATHFIFIDGHSRDSDFINFFNWHGHLIKTLEIEKSLGYTGKDQSGIFESSNNFQDLLIGAINLKNLHLKNLDPKNNLDLHLHLHFPSLKMFSWERSLKIAAKILDPKSTPQLESIPLVESLDDVTPILENGRGHLVHGLKIGGQLYPEELKKSENLTQVKKLVINIEKYYTLRSTNQQDFEKLKIIFDTLLNLWKDTLEFLEYTELCTTFDLYLPQFKSLRVLVLGSKFSSCAERLFPPRICLAEIFPNLEVLDCSRLRTRVDETWRRYLPLEDPCRGQFESVQILEISDQFTSIWLDIFHQLCPKFKSLAIHGGWEKTEIDNLLPIIFTKWTHLRSIEVKFNDSAGKNLDPILIGGPNLENEESSTSIRNLTDLTHFKITLGYRCHDTRSSNPPPLSILSWTQVLQGMPKLGVTLEYDHGSQWAQDFKPQLMALAPFVTLRHAYNYQNVQYHP